MNFLLLALLILTQGLRASEVQQDVVLKAKFDHQTSSSMVRRLRTFMLNNDLGDPYHQTLRTPLKIELSRVFRDLPPETQEWIKELQSLLNLNVLESSYSITVEKLEYSLESYNSVLSPVSSSTHRVDYVTNNLAKGLQLRAEKIIFEIEIKRTRSGEPLRFGIVLLGPEFIINPDLIVDLPMGWSSQLLPDSLMLSLNSIDLSKVFKSVLEKPENIDFNVKDMIIPDVSLRVGERSVRFDKQKTKKFFGQKKDDMKVALLDLMSSRLDRFTNIIENNPKELFFNRHYSISGDIHPVFYFKSLNADADAKVLEAKVDGQFCLSEPSLTDGHCPLGPVDSKERRKISDQMFQASMLEITQLFNDKRSNVAVSISENYINQILTAAVKAGRLKLEGRNFVIGPEGAFILAEEKGETFNLYLDITKELSGRQRIMVGLSKLRFPVRLQIALKINNVNNTPRFQIRVKAIKTGEDLLIKGLPEYGLLSNVGQARFRSTVIANINEEIKPFNNKLLMDIELKEFRDTYLEELSFFSDGLGRGTAVTFLNGQKKR